MTAGSSSHIARTVPGATPADPVLRTPIVFFGREGIPWIECELVRDPLLGITRHVKRTVWRRTVRVHPNWRCAKRLIELVADQAMIHDERAHPQYDVVERARAL